MFFFFRKRYDNEHTQVFIILKLWISRFHYEFKGPYSLHRTNNRWRTIAPKDNDRGSKNADLLF